MTLQTTSISSSTQYVTLRKYFSHPSLVLYFFATPPIKLKLGQQIGGGLLIANQWTNHYDGPIRNTEQQLDHIYYTLLFKCTALLCALPTMATCAIMPSQNHFPQANSSEKLFQKPEEGKQKHF